MRSGNSPRAEATLRGGGRRGYYRAVLGPALLLGAFFVGRTARAGPPFLTDDPEPVELGHWEFYLASQWTAEDHSATGSTPHVEVNYGALPELQLHVIVPATLAWQSGQPVQYGLGDIELGAKYRFVEEGERRPQIGTFPLVLVPTGSKERGLGAGTTQVFLPIWIQKSFGPWMTYGGAGLHIASGDNDIVAGWLLQRKLPGMIALAAEAFFTFPLNENPVELQVNLGLVVDFSDRHHLLASAGPAFGGEARGQGYLAYQLTI
ncbi:MAG TPA: hypothetical protein VFG23_25325 [Polyangia bacterium]|nr:hypothetical protein [Polyangia bacterium]